MENLALARDDWERAHPFPFEDTRDFLRNNHIDRPYLLFDRGELGRTVKMFQRHFPGEVSFAVKANPDPLVLMALHQFGVGSFDVASIGEIEQLRSLFPDCALHFNNPIRTHDVVQSAFYHHGVRSFVVDDQVGLDQLEGLCGDRMEITVRFKLEHDSAAYDFGSKFGATEDQCVELVKRASTMCGKSSLTFHPGSQCTDPSVYARYIAASARIASRAGVDLYRLNVGGGFPVAYPCSSVPGVEKFFSVINEVVNTSFPNNRPELLCEPGRALVASCASLLTQVIHIRENGDVFVNDGVYGSLQEQAIMKAELPLKAWRHGEALDTERSPRRIFGPTCDPVDRLSMKFPVPNDIVAGDFVEFGFMGAYGSATATRFNGFEPAQYVTVNNGYFSNG